MKFKRDLAVALLTSAALLSPVASHAADGFVKGTVEFMRLHDGTVNPTWTPPRFWFALTGVLTAGVCPATWNARIVFVGDSKEAYLTVLGAFMTGREVAVYFDDTLLANGSCRAAAITLGDPPPLF
jgi:hypothetical protein